jgi:hypothetical protein
MKVVLLCMASFFANGLGLCLAGAGWGTGDQLALMLIALPFTLRLATGGALSLVVQHGAYPPDGGARARKPPASPAPGQRPAGLALQP